jgi:urease accessory protein
LSGAAVANGSEAQRLKQAPPGWHASLELVFAHVDGRTVLARRAHRGPLVVQKPLYPEDAALCQCVIVHPPAGIVGGDRLTLSVHIGSRSLVQLTTPGATKWYRSAGAEAVQAFDAHVGDGATLEWLPQGAIVYEGARARNRLTVHLANRASVIALDVVALGRRAADERFRCGEWRQRIEFVRNGAPIWSERAVVRGGSRLLSSPAGLNDASVVGTFVASAPSIATVPLAALRDIARNLSEVAVTLLPDAIVARYLGHSMEAAHRCFWTMWSAVRPALSGRAAVFPRIWRT